MIQFDFEGHLAKVGGSKLESRLREIDAAIARDLCASQRFGLAAGVAAGDIEEQNGFLNSSTRKSCKSFRQSMGENVGVDDLLICRPLTLELLECERVDDGCAPVEFADHYVHGRSSVMRASAQGFGAGMPRSTKFSQLIGSTSDTYRGELVTEPLVWLQADAALVQRQA